uniref:Diacylglycerol kinase n=1 Tax=Ascaris lumbricoides TaxID=6252 RepID=A0A0M3HRS9_ASCLU
MIWPLIVISLLLIAVTQLLRRILRPRVVEYETNDVEVSSSGHHFVSLTESDHGRYCSLCESGMQSGMQCDFCGVMVDTRLCLHSLSSTVPCKMVARTTDNDIMHHWVRGNLPSGSVCISCEEMCGDGVGLVDYRCALCQATVHADCKYSVGERCNLGANRDFIIPPNYVTIRQAGTRRKKQLVVESMTLPSGITASSWRPLFVLVNPRSGGAEGFATLQAFRRYLHPVQVINIDYVSVNTALRWIETNPQINCYVLVAGGDGTISLVLDAMRSLQRQPPVAILPLGTGNDLSRVLGWGSGHSGSIEFSKFYRAVHFFGEFITGVINFAGMQSTRSSIPRAFSSRLLNKLLFFTYGTKDVLEHACADLEKKVELIVDGTIIELPPLEGITILNIPCWGAGVRPWPDLPDMPQSTDDSKFSFHIYWTPLTWNSLKQFASPTFSEKFEVFGVRSSFHIAQMQMGVSQSIPLAQGRSLKLRIFGSALPMQCDGEAWMQHPGTLNILHLDQASLLWNDHTTAKEKSNSFFYL